MTSLFIETGDCEGAGTLALGGGEREREKKQTWFSAESLFYDEVNHI